jgi:hypothetical protein
MSLLSAQEQVAQAPPMNPGNRWLSELAAMGSRAVALSGRAQVKILQ